MGYYINPENESKEAFLAKNGREVSRAEVMRHDFAGDSLPVVLVNNFSFTAAGIAYDKQELDDWMNDRSGRPVRFFVVSKKNLEPWYKGQ